MSVDIGVAEGVYVDVVRESSTGGRNVESFSSCGGCDEYVCGVHGAALCAVGRCRVSELDVALNVANGQHGPPVAVFAFDGERSVAVDVSDDPCVAVFDSAAADRELSVVVTGDDVVADSGLAACGDRRALARNGSVEYAVMACALIEFADGLGVDGDHQRCLPVLDVRAPTDVYRDEHVFTGSPV